jgi:meso-butanediol dehydrogenase / (S,S)-butanediol dehydrogenase / diacetyl reductase
MSIHPRLSGKVVIITGTGDGQGRAAALRFVAEGARVVGCDLNAESAAETEDQVEATGGEFLSIAPLDLTLEDNVAELVATAVERFGRIDALYNNAAAARLGTALEISLQDAEFTLRGVLGIPWLVTRHAVPHLARSTGAAVVNTASVSGIVGAGMVGNATLLSIYGAAKAALIRLSQSMAVEFGPLGIRVNTISPGLIETPAVAAILGTGTDERLRHWHEEQVLIQRIGQPEDVVNAALFLLSDEASYITGHNLVVDGGWVASGGVGHPRADVLAALRESLAAGLRY